MHDPRPHAFHAARGAGLLLAWLALGCGGANGSTQRASHQPIALTQVLDLDGAALTMSVRGDDGSLPLLLVIHGGPGFAMLNLLHDRVPELEKAFVVVSYDQRGAGLSYADDIDPRTMTLAQFVADADSVRAHALELLDRQDSGDVYVMGHSMGTMIGLNLVQKYPEHYAAYIGVGQVVSVVDNEQGSYDFALAQAAADQNQQALDELRCVGRPGADFSYPLPLAGSSDHCSAETDGFDVTNRWIGYYGGDQYGKHDTSEIEDAILGNPAYEGHVEQWSAGLDFSATLFDDAQVIAWDARKLHVHDRVPLYFFMGRHDYDTPAPLVEAYANVIEGPHRLVWFEASAHFPFYEQPALFAQRLRAILDGSLKASPRDLLRSAPGLQ